MATGAFAQMSSFPKPSYFRETFNKANTKVELQPPVRLQDFVASGEGCVQPETIKMPSANQGLQNATELGLTEDASKVYDISGPMPEAPGGAKASVNVPEPLKPEPTPAKCLRLGLRDFVDLVMANNTDIQISYLTVETSKNNVTSVYGRWDPSATFGFSPSWSYKDSQKNNPFPTTSKTESWPLNFGFSETLSSGQTIRATGNGSKTASWGGNPSFSSGMSFSIAQPLIQNRGSYINRLPLLQAQSSLKTTQFGLANTLISDVSAAETAYWNVVSAREQLFVSEMSWETDRKLLAYNVHQYQLGGLSYLGLYRPQTTMAGADAALSSARYSLSRTLDALRKQVAADLDPAIRDLPIVLTDSPELSASEAIVPDREQEVQMALATHPTIKTYIERLNSDEMSLQSAKNGLLPNLSLTASYNGAGAGSLYTGGFGTSYYGPPIPGGLGDALSQMFGWGNPTYQMNLQLTLPIRSRSASMTMANALIGKKSDALTLRTQQQGLRLNVLNALTSLQGAKDQLALAKVQADYSQLDYDAQNLEYRLGTNTQIDVVNSAQALAGNLQALVNAQVSLRLSLLALYQSTGELLDRRGIVIK